MEQIGSHRRETARIQDKVNMKSGRESEESLIGERDNPGRFMGKWLKRGVMALVGFTLSVFLMAWVFLPRIAERLLRDAIAAAGLDRVELQVVDIGLGSMVLEAVLAEDGNWAVQADRVVVNYDVLDLVNGKTKELVVEGMVVDVSLPEVEGLSTDLKANWVHDVSGLLERVGEVRAEGAKLTIGRGGELITRLVDFEVIGSEGGLVSTVVQADDFKCGIQLESSGMHCDISMWLNDLRPGTFLSMLEVVLGFDQPLLPEGMGLATAELTGGLVVDHGDLSPLALKGVLEELVYDQGDKPVKFLVKRAEMDVVVDSGGGGSLDISGLVDEVSLLLNHTAGLDLLQAKGEPAPWELRGFWGQESVRLTGQVSGLNLRGAYDGKAVALDAVTMGFKMVDNMLEVEGGFSNGGVKVPVQYRHRMDYKGESWMMSGKLELGPLLHDRTLPGLMAVTDVFDNVKMAGESHVDLGFSVGENKAFEGKMTARLKNMELDVEDGMVRASGVNGVYELHIMPRPDVNQGRDDSSDYTMDFSVAKMEIDSEAALDFKLTHELENPLTFRGKGQLGKDGASLAGEVKGVTLRGEKGGAVLDLQNIGFGFELQGEQLRAEGAVTLESNEIPFVYKHQRKDVNGGWELVGSLAIDELELKEPVANAVMFVEAMKDKSISGKVSMRMEFSIGSEKDFDASLEAAISGGLLSFADDGPVIEGLEGDIKLDSLKQEVTQGYHHVKATGITAFDVKMKNLGLDYQLLANGDISLRKLTLEALGGQLLVDDFILPAGDEDYGFTLRARKLDVAQLAALFPDFSGSISGRIDGLLPVESKGGKLGPGRGEMYLTPKTRGKLKYDAGNSFSSGLDPKTEEYKRMKMVEESLRDLDLKVLSIRLFDPPDKDKAVLLRLEGQASRVKGSPPIHLNVNGFNPDDDTVDFFDLLLRHRDKLNFGL